MTTSVVLCHVSASPDRTLARLQAEGQPSGWLFLCQDYLKLLEWQAALNPLAECLPVGHFLNQAAEGLRRPFLDLITELGGRYNSIAWWGSRLSERNTMVSPLFLYCCYLKIGQDALETSAGTLCVVGESWEVLESLAEIARNGGSRVIWVTRPAPGRRRATYLVRSGKRLTQFMGTAISQRRRDSSRNREQDDRPSILLRTWVDETCFGEDGAFHDRYMPGLCQWLESNGCVVTTIPVLFNLKRTYDSAWCWLRDSQQKFLNPFSRYQFGDYLFALKEAWRQTKLPEGQVRLDGLDVSRLFDAERRRGAFDVSCLESILSYRLPRRLAESLYRIDLCIDVFENMIPEKLLILGFRNFLPTTRLVGFQHGSLYPLLLCLFVTKGESGFAPTPDRIVCSGEFFRDILVDEGLPAEKTVVGPALRYAHLWEPLERTAGQPGDQSYILVPLPLVLDSAVELLTKVVAALEPMGAIRVMVKPHPMSTPELLLAAAKLKRLPPQFEFVQGKMGEWLSRSQLVISLSSSTVHETLAAGVPVVVVGRETALDLNSLSWYEDLGQVVRHPHEIREEVLRLLTLSPESLAHYQQRGREVLGSCFSPVTGPAMQAFVNGLVEMPGGHIGVEARPAAPSAP